MAQTNEPLLSVKGLKQYFPVSKKFTVRAVDNISFDISWRRPDKLAQWQDIVLW